MKSKNISVLGGGSWGTVLANLASSNQHDVTFWMRDTVVVEAVNKTKRNFWKIKSFYKKNQYTFQESEIYGKRLIIDN